ncbi:hypothetical protein R3P38DRAFT_2860335 [Favolaschia claudopus]|uniref:Secreted protein n=1 Tax=Favolaschia claudopus TaxID=2862362 RepID=A0AAW0DNG1_9AGAR
MGPAHRWLFSTAAATRRGFCILFSAAICAGIPAAEFEPRRTALRMSWQASAEGPTTVDGGCTGRSTGIQMNLRGWGAKAIWESGGFNGGGHLQRRLLDL